MSRRECGVDARADRAREEEHVALDAGRRGHRTITSPSMSWLWSVQT